MTNKEMILFLFYNQHLKQNEIAKRTGTTKQYVSKIVKQDSRNIEEKESRKQSNISHLIKARKITHMSKCLHNIEKIS